MLEATHMLGALSSWLTVGAAALTEGTFPWLTVVTFAPLVGVLALMLIPKEQVGALRNAALFFSLGIFFISLGILVNFDPNAPAAAGPFTFQLAEGPIPWIESIGISYYMGIDGISLWLVMLTTFLMPITIFSTYSAVDTNVKEYMIALLFLETGMLGALMSLDVFLFYIFWEMMLIPMYLIIGVWGGEKRILASVKFFLYTMVGSLLMLIAILYVYFQTGGADGGYSFLLSDMLAVDLSYKEQFILFGAFFLAFAIKVPLFPFHTWLPLAHVQAPTAGSVILAGVLLKMGTYGLIRYAFPLFPDALKAYAPYIAVLSVIGIVYGALVALVQDDVKKLVAYSSVSHLGFCVLGLIAMTPQGLAGGIYVMIAHGIATGGLFLCVGILKERRHTKKIKDFGGIAKPMPIFAAIFGIIVFASAGLPGLNGFVGEFLALVGASKSHFLWFDEPLVFLQPMGEGARQAFELSSTPVFPLPNAQQAGPELTALIFAIIGASGVIFAAGYLLWMFRRVMFGPITHEENKNLKDLNAREIAYFVPIVAMAIIMGVYPKFFLSRMDSSLDQFLRYMDNNVSATGSVVVEPTEKEGWYPEGKLLDGKKDDAE
ncbi:NADH-quinone oxidoreductase subunit M [Persicimonas caeni]|uniref:NADH-quinone oxidoreductase subunit M n=1 Tax=Persicimonas caeni TaxID=2292766 RepID=A0A4Y6PLP0_PERCE|nr:NADH-quinone oxidoreductase subunit M [Persicimonas caeni]QDG49198.1 NADH-quinone oxidoreductase subunit M [Persicimonas caeni]QED30419.1 NADH-quinone oxidoreductase subunit M [Persicimonas caeni]